MAAEMFHCLTETPFFGQHWDVPQKGPAQHRAQLCQAEHPLLLYSSAQAVGKEALENVRDLLAPGIIIIIIINTCFYQPHQAALSALI